MDTSTPNPADVAMERLHSQIALARERLAGADRVLEIRARDMLVSETPVADHAYRLARDDRGRLRTRLEGLESDLGRLILEREGLLTPRISA
jgi:hypothetical protein